MNTELQHKKGVELSNNKCFRFFDNKITKLLKFILCGLRSVNCQLTTHYSQFTKKSFAFTLAETLIVMGVIGIVSALTLPNLNSSTGDKEKVAKVKKIYQNLNDAFGRAQAVYGPYDDWFVNLSSEDIKNKRRGERITEFMKISKNCELLSGKGCFKGGDDKETACYKVITADGTSVSIGSYVILVDIDGPNKGKTDYGNDLFEFTIETNNGTRSIYPRYYKDFETSPAFFMQEVYLRDAASAWIILFGNMDYLKVNPSDGKCKNNTSITLDGVTNTTCK